MLWPINAEAESLLPTPVEVQHATNIASIYWHGNPPCGPTTLTFGPTLPEHAGRAHIEECRIELASEGIDWRDYPEDFCVDLTHEWGHLVLGPDYFAAVNPADPAHSPDPANVMYANPNPLSVPACHEVVKLVKAKPASRHRRQRRHRSHHHHVP